MDEGNCDICWCVRTEALASVSDDKSCHDDEFVLPPDYSAFGSLVFPHLFTNDQAEEDVDIHQDDSAVGPRSRDRGDGVVGTFVSELEETVPERSLPCEGVPWLDGDYEVMSGGKADRMENGACVRAGV